MEKYSRWSDLSTGINPFVPQQARLHSNVAVKALQLLGGTALVVVRAPLVLVVSAVLVVTNIITSVLAIIPFVGRLLKRLTEWLLCSLLLLVLGVFVSEEEANARRLGLVAPGAKAKKHATRAIGAKDLIVCNHTSFVEILFLARRFSPLFVFVSDDGASKGLVHVCGLLEALYRSFALPVALERSTPRKLDDVLRTASGPVVIFPEGARSNGKSILRFVPVLEHLPLELPTKAGARKLPLRVHLLAFRFETGSTTGFSASQSAGSGWRHLFWTAFHGYHSLRVTLLHANDLNVLEPTPKSRTGSSSSSAATLTHAQVERLRSLLAAMLRTKTVDLGVADFCSFNAYWTHVTAGGRKAAAEFTDRKAPHEHAQWSNKMK